LLLGLAVSAAALALVLRWAGWGPLNEALRRVEPGYLLLGVLVYRVDAGAAWKVLIGRPVGYGRLAAQRRLPAE
jgi:hypothetical protein